MTHYRLNNDIADLLETVEDHICQRSVDRKRVPISEVEEYYRQGTGDSLRRDLWMFELDPYMFTTAAKWKIYDNTHYPI